MADWALGTSLSSVPRMCTLLVHRGFPFHCLLQDGEVLPMGGGGEILATGDGGKAGVDDEEEEEEEEEVMVFDKHDALLHGDSRAEKFVSSKFLKKYIHVARALKPVLTREACDLISTEYAKLRSQENANSDTAKVSFHSLCCVLTRDEGKDEEMWERDRLKK